MDNRQISIAIPSFNRVDMTFDSFKEVYDDERVSEIIIVDDVSRDGIYEQLQERAEKYPKIKLFRNEVNQDCYKNKMTAVSHSSNDNCILLDSDNHLSIDYLNKIFQIEHWEENAAYLPSFAAPHFDYRKFEGLEITSANVARYMGDPVFTTMLNTHNHFVNKNFYLKCWVGIINPHTADSIYMNYLWLMNRGKLFVVPGLTYQHRVDDHHGEESGHYQKNCYLTGNFHQEVEQLLKQLT